MKPRSPIQRIWFYPALFIAAVITLTLTSIRPNTVAQEKTPRSGSDYRKDWEAVEKKESEDLPKSAKSLVEAIYQKAKREENAAQQVKALMHLTKYQAQIEEEGLVKGIQDFEKEIAAASFPVKPLLNSVLADFYWQYYSNNRYKFLNRTPGGVMDDKDVRTWDLEKLLARVTALHQAAVQDAARLQQTPLEIYEQVLEEATNSKLYRPTLYDFIAHRAITFFINEERALSKPTNEFELTSLDGLAPVETFSKVKFKSENGGALDSASLKVQALLMYQSLARFHLADKNPDALIDLDLERLTYTRRITFNETKDSAYVAALTALERKYAASSMSTQVLYTLAEFYFAEGSAKGSDGLNGKQRALKIAEDAIARNASSRGGQNAANLKGRILGKNITLQTERSVEPAKPFRAAVGYTNVSKVFYRVVRVDDDLMEKLRYDSYDEG
ncbi:MAG: hypothetical protein IAF08_03445, partial [Rhizobacter sp.]|nr:hypothetical protein [Chlorobiales bacterium]